MEFANHPTHKHCDAALCHQLDFLPFHCKECDHTFCAEHQAWKDHNCAVGLRQLLGRVALPCPDCKQMVSQREGQTFEESLALHVSEPGACKPDLSAADRAKAARKQRPRCAVKGCKESIRAAYMQFNCRSCQSKYCLKHRTVESHQCKEKRADHYQALARDRRATAKDNARGEQAPGQPLGNNGGTSNFRPRVAVC